jgi:protocatechuate 3,4-dioxygenase beta subunit
MYVEGRVLTTSGEPIPGAVIDTWETDGTGKQHFELACVLPDDEPPPSTLFQAGMIWNIRKQPRQSAAAG